MEVLPMMGLASNHRQRGFVLITMLFVLILFTAGAMTAVQGVRSAVRASQSTKHVKTRENLAQGGVTVVLAYMLSHPGVSHEDLSEDLTGDYFPRPAGTLPEYKVVITKVDEQLAREIPGYSEPWLGTEYDFYSGSWDHLRAGAKTVEVLAFVPERPQVPGND